MDGKNLFYERKVEISRNRGHFRPRQTSILVYTRRRVRTRTRRTTADATVTPGRQQSSPGHLGWLLLDSVMARTPWTTPPLRILGFRRYFQPDYSRSRLHPSVFVYTICQKPHEVYPSSVKPPVHNYDIKTLVQGP